MKSNEDIARRTWKWPAMLIVLLSASTFGANVTIQMVNIQFVPQDTTVNAGDVVTWTNLDNGVNHTSTSGTNGVPSGLWDSGFYGQGGSFSFSFSVPPGLYDYYCTAHYRIGMVGSLTVLPNNLPPPPMILTQPASQSVFVGSTVSFFVTASGASPLTYQWQFDGQPITAATNDTLVLGNVQTNNSGNYTVVVGNPGGSTNSQPAVLTVSPPQPGVPVVNIVSPTNGAILPAFASVLLSASAAESNGTITQVAFFLNAISVGLATNSPFDVLVSNLTAGTFLLTAIATDAQSKTATSPVVRFTVPSAPTVTLMLSPTNSHLPQGTVLTNTAIVSTSGSTVTNVEFLDGITLLGSAAAPPFSFIWTPTQARRYSLTAVVMDNLGQAVTSAPVALVIFAPDSAPPTIRITNSPPDFARLTEPLQMLAGTASDDVGVDHVEYQVNGGPFVAASGTNAWLANIPLPAGQVIILVRSVDLALNASFPATRYFTHVVRQSLAVHVRGGGLVTPDLNGGLLEIGKRYTLSARAGPGQIFAGWQGVPNTTAPVLDFLMQSNLVIEADFVPNPFPGLAGSYAGLILDTNNVFPATSASFALQLRDSGAFSGKLGMNGLVYSFRGQFNVLGHAGFSVVRGGLPPELLALQLDVAESAGQITDTATTTAGGLLTTPLLALQNGFNLTDNHAPQAGVHPFILQRTADDGGAVVGTASADIGTTGIMRIQGQLRDGRHFGVALTLSTQGDAPFYISLSHGTEVMIGWLHFAADPAAAVSGTLYWVKTGPGGFSLRLSISPAAQ